MAAEFQVLQVTWKSHAPQLTPIRQEVFVEEQEVDPAFEWDEIDAVAVHLLALSGDQPIGCARIIDFKKIGRMAVVKAWRGRGVGQALLNKAVAICQAQGSQVVKLTAQTHAITFYEQAGFVATSGVYQDANIPHVDMQLQLIK
jgi:predicted GNAT family N-acyltransferase